MTGEEILEKMSEGFALHSCLFGFFLVNPLDGYTVNVHHGAAKALVRNRRIRRTKGDGYEWEWERVNLQEGNTI